MMQMLQVVTAGPSSSTRSSIIYDYFFNIMDSGILPPMYSVEEFFALKEIRDPDRSGILSKVTLDFNHQVSFLLYRYSFSLLFHSFS